MKRRVFLISGAIVAAVASTAGLLRWLGFVPSAEPELQDDTPLAPGAPDQPAAVAKPETQSARLEPIFPPEDHAIVFLLADLIVPREGEHPAASEIDLLPRLEGWIRSSKSRERAYKKGWPKLRQLVKRVRVVDGKPDPLKLTMRMGKWVEKYRRQKRSFRVLIPFFEQFRSDVLRVYYASPAGWAAMGYRGPAHVSRVAGRSSVSGESHT